MSPAVDQKKRSSLAKLHLLLGFGTDSSAAANQPPAASASDGSVGLGLVASLCAADAPTTAAVTRMDPVVAIPAAKSAGKRRIPTVEEMERSETYTCVISYLGGHPVRKRVYYGDEADGIVGELRSDRIVFFELSPSTLTESLMGELPRQMDGFLSRCVQCKVELEGKDIYMYRGEEGFCSEECRAKKTAVDELVKKCAGSGADIDDVVALPLYPPDQPESNRQPFKLSNQSNTCMLDLDSREKMM